MNSSRMSYSCPIDTSTTYHTDVILQMCEFCSRTFIPDSLTRHRKICYNQYLKKKSILSKKSALSRSKSTIDMPGMNFTDVMLKRQIRRMNWRIRHEDFAKSIREAKSYFTSSNAGFNIPVSFSSNEHNEDMQSCQYCLRRFHRDTFEKHLNRCKEYSIRSIKSRSDEAHMEAKRRMSLRLCYKPKSFRGDSPDELSTSASNIDLDCPTLNSFTCHPNKFKVHSSAHSDVNSNIDYKIKQQRSISNSRYQVSVSCNKVKRNRSTVFRKCKESEKIYKNTSLCNVNLELQSTQKKNKNKSSNILPNTEKKSSECENSVKNLRRNKKSNAAEKSNVENNESDNSKQYIQLDKNLLNNGNLTFKGKPITRHHANDINNHHSNDANISIFKFTLPNPAQSLRSAKEILKYLDERMQQSKYHRDSLIFVSEKHLETMRYNQLNTSHRQYNESCDSPYDNNIPYVLLYSEKAKRDSQAKAMNITNQFNMNDKHFNSLAETLIRKPPNGIDQVKTNESHFVQYAERNLETKNLRTCNISNETVKITDTSNKSKVANEAIICQRTNNGNRGNKEDDSKSIQCTMAHIDPEYAKIWKLI